MYFIVVKGQSNDDVGVSRDTVFQEIRPGAGFQPAISLKKSSGGYRRTTLPLILALALDLNNHH